MQKIRNAVPGIALRTTLIVGYPNETEREFEELVQFIKDVQFDRLGVFTYSQEDETLAYDLGDPVPALEKERRKEYLMDIQREISLHRNESRIGMNTTALIERFESGLAVGRSEWDAPDIDNEIFLTPSDADGFHVGDFVPVTITNASEFDLYGEVIQRS